MSFVDLDSGLRDCEIAFDDLRDKSPFCGGPELSNGRLCQRYSISQFPEVVKVSVYLADGALGSCSGTVIAHNWIISAAHCFLAEKATTTYTGDARKDFVWTPLGRQPFSAAAVDAENAKMLLRDQRRRFAKRVVVYGDYGGKVASPPFANDLALIELDAPFPGQAVQPARLASEKEFSAGTTLAGYGYSNADAGTFGQFNLTWPKPVSRNAKGLSFALHAGDKTKSAFCQGDSGGPAFAGRYRGCKPYDVVAEPRPRLLQGTISFNYLGAPDPSAVTEEQRASSSCRSGGEMVMQDITIAFRRNWICRVTGNAPLGCDKDASR